MSEAGGTARARFRAALVVLFTAIQACPGYRRLAKAVPGEVVVRAATIEDDARLAAGRETSPKVSDGDLRGEDVRSAQGHAARVLVAVRGRRIVGWASVALGEAGIGPWPGWWIWRLYVRLPYRGRGIAERLVEEACALVRMRAAKV